ncbi:unnamed protein product [Fraxinus pennsylvanica]|uniref:Uncharacterized protein n=1 Tax=Fraxinus pennsylvanica TaxID=56036 RepID=A0AAD1YT32_9LAMI|nr:unnamed protein product [Fraxinus pennsylvanica]
MPNTPSASPTTTHDDLGVPPFIPDLVHLAPIIVDNPQSIVPSTSNVRKSQRVSKPSTRLRDFHFIKVDRRLTELLIAFMSSEYPGSNLEIKGGITFISATDGWRGMREAEATWAQSLISSNGELTRDSTLPAANPAIRALETCT